MTLPSSTRTAIELLSALYDRGTTPQPPAGFTTDTLIGAVRHMREQEEAGRRAPEAGQFVRSVSLGFGDRVDDRIALLSALMASPDAECRLDALWPAQKLVEGWRGDYVELVMMMGGRLHDDDPWVRSRAADVLQHFDVLAVPAADALVAALESAPRRVHSRETNRQLTWIVQWDRDWPSPSPAIRALAGTRDVRTLPMLEWLLWQDDMPPDTGYLIGRFGETAAIMLPSLRRRLQDMPAGPDHRRHRSALCFALRQLGPFAADALPELLELPMSSETAPVFGRIGPAAAVALPMLLEAAASDDRWIARAAATAVYDITGAPAAALDTAARLLDLGEWEAVSALGLLKDIGNRALPLIDRVRGHLSTENGVVLAAQLVWRADRDPTTVMPVLMREWTKPQRRSTIAAIWAEMGRAAADAEPTLLDELDRVRRHNVSETGWSSVLIPDDLALLALCRTAIDGFTA